MPADEVLVALTIGVKNQSLETTIEILIHEPPPVLILCILVMQFRKCFQMFRIKNWSISCFLEFTSIKVKGLGVSEPIGFLRLQLQVQLFVLVLSSAVGQRKGSPRL